MNEIAPPRQLIGYAAEKLCAVVVSNFEYLKAQHIANAREWVVWELESLGRELPEYQRVPNLYLVRPRAKHGASR